jgi:hypothetical protein
MVPLAMLLIVAILISAVSEWISDRWQSPAASFMRRRQELVWKAHEVLSPQTIRERLAEKYPSTTSSHLQRPARRGQRNPHG